MPRFKKEDTDEIARLVGLCIADADRARDVNAFNEPQVVEAMASRSKAYAIAALAKLGLAFVTVMNEEGS